MNPLPASTWAYVAGVMDADGWFSIHQETPQDRPGVRWHGRAGIGNISKQLMDWLLSTFGGTVYDHHKKNASLGHQKLYTWRINGGEQRLWFVRGILPYLIVKKRQAELLLEMWEGIDTSTRVRVTEAEYSRRVRILTEFRALKARRLPCKPLA